MGQFIHKDKSRVDLQDLIQVHLLEPDSPVLHFLPRDNRKPVYQGLRLDSSMGLDIPDLDVNTLVLAQVRCPEHLVGLTHPGDITKEYLQFSPVFLPLSLSDADEKCIRIRTAYLRVFHRLCITLPAASAAYQCTPSSTNSISMIFIPMNGAISPPTP